MPHQHVQGFDSMIVFVAEEQENNMKNILKKYKFIITNMYMGLIHVNVEKQNVPI